MPNTGDNDGCFGGCFGLLIFIFVIYILFKIGGWVLSTFGVIGLIVYLLVILG